MAALQRFAELYSQKRPVLLELPISQNVPATYADLQVLESLHQVQWAALPVFLFEGPRKMAEEQHAHHDRPSRSLYAFKKLTLIVSKSANDSKMIMPHLSSGHLPLVPAS